MTARILVVDDIAVNVRLLEAKLLVEYYDVVAASDGPTALELAKERGYRTVRLDVIDTNPRARALYEREGFEPVHTESFPALRPVLGFGASTTMVWSDRPGHA